MWFETVIVHWLQVQLMSWPAKIVTRTNQIAKKQRLRLRQLLKSISHVQRPLKVQLVRILSKAKVKVGPRRPHPMAKVKIKNG